MANLTKEQESAIIPELYREQYQAVKCKHLRFGPLARTTETLRPMPVIPRNGPILLPHEIPAPAKIQLTPVTLWPNFPTVSFTCNSPEMVDWVHHIIPREVHGAVNNLETTLSACQCCSLWQERDSQ